MTDNEIVKALEHCTQHKCHECPRYYETPDDADICETHLMRNALDLINRQKAEIERLNSLLDEWKKQAYKLSDSIDSARTEAIKEFEKAAGEEISKIPQYHFSFLTVKEAIEKTRKKLAGDAE